MSGTGGVGRADQGGRAERKALADSPTISRAAAIRTPSSEAPSLLLSTVSPARGGSSAPTEPEQLETPQTVARPLDPVASPTFTLSPPEGATQELDSMREEYESMQDGAERENRELLVRL